MAAYAPPHSTPYSNAAYAGPPPQVQVQQAPLQSVQQPPYQRARGSSNGSYDGPQHAQQLTPYAAAPGAAPYGSPALAHAPNGQAYFPPMPHVQSTAALVPAPAQLHPQEAYAVAAADPYAQRPRTSSTASHHSHRSHHSAASHHSHRSKASSRHSANDEDRRKPGERATLGDTLMGMWRVLRDMIPTEKR